MILNARNNGFVFIFPPDFFAEEVKEKYKKYYQSLILPYDTIEDFMSSTIQSIEFPGWSMNLAQQTRTRGKKQEYKSSKPIEDLFNREFTLTFKMTDAFLNYWIFLDNALNYINFDNREQTFSPMLMSMVDNQGYMVSNIRFNDPILKAQDSIKFSYSSVTPEFRTFNAKFQYLDFDLDIEFS
jgi:hypothetical protein